MYMWEMWEHDNFERWSCFCLDTGSSQKMPSTASPSPQPVHTQKPSSTPSQAQPSPASDKHSNTRASESRKPGRGKSKKGSIKETSVGLPVTPPSAPKLQGKITPFEFLQHWNSLKQAKEIQPYVQLLEQISPDDLPGGVCVCVWYRKIIKWMCVCVCVCDRERGSDCVISLYRHISCLCWSV